jgi:hypothetical protein
MSTATPLEIVLSEQQLNDLADRIVARILPTQHSADRSPLVVSEDAAWLSFVNEWWSTFGDRAVRVADLFDLAVQIDGMPLGLSPHPRGQRTALGQSLGRMRNKRFGPFLITYAGISHNAATYRLWLQEEDF